MDKGAEARRRRREQREMEGRMCECGGKIGGGQADYYVGPRCDCGHPKPVTEKHQGTIATSLPTGPWAGGSR